MCPPWSVRRGAPTFLVGAVRCDLLLVGMGRALLPRRCAHPLSWSVRRAFPPSRYDGAAYSRSVRCDAPFSSSVRRGALLPGQ
ncbi:uncharacterized protein SCHCODRAFT_02613745 [Schizophyllum commune H4-8]|uniref:uncharacterized protein n=1 Tax=Schizophyllum commune (strain H4-8 / FGSC 9210) TaxID=578458 RepID=UPI00215E1817|nr:uncharacterized protein SCHCODRAFT_02613745 [Schizophyllum commune H4-8]KAI5895993.1 hypothetical protein SCHCODRAFT_02613745 [Schizophyllum commune H4-8]